jgi:predicted MFS family arabinose efflux permease
MRIEMTRSALSIPAYRRYATGAAFWFTATRMQRIAIAWSVWSTTQSATWLGILTVAELLPILLLSSYAGVLVDRYGARRMLALTLALSITQNLVLFAFVYAGAGSAIIFVGATLAFGFIASLGTPAELAMVPFVVGRENISSAISWNGVIINASLFAGPAFGSWVLDEYGLPLTILLCTCMSLVFFFVVIAGKSVPKAVIAQAGAEPKARVGGMLSEFATIISSPVVVMIVACAAVSVGGRAVIQILASFVGNSLHGGPQLLGWCTSAAGLGAIAGSLIAGYFNSEGQLFRLISLQLVLTALLLFAIPAMPSISAVLVALTLFGMTLGLNGVGTQSYVQMYTAEHNRGRMLGHYVTFNRGGIAVGSLILSAAGASYGDRWSMWVGGIIVIAAAVYVPTAHARWLRANMRIKESPLF